jgi:hypothetical protein
MERIDQHLDLRRIRYDWRIALLDPDFWNFFLYGWWGLNLLELTARAWRISGKGTWAQCQQGNYKSYLPQFYKTIVSPVITVRPSGQCTTKDEYRNNHQYRNHVFSPYLFFDSLVY